MDPGTSMEEKKEQNGVSKVKFSDETLAENFDKFSDKQPVSQNLFENGTDASNDEVSEANNQDKSVLQDLSSSPKVDDIIDHLQPAGEKDERTGNGMIVSHTESGYLTDSVISREKESTQDSSAGSHTSNSSEQDITPCAENLITFSTSSSNMTSPVSPYSEEASIDTENSVSRNTDQIYFDSDDTSSGPEDHAGQVNKIFDECTAIIDQKSRIEQLDIDSLARMNLNCDRNDLMNIDDIIATNFAPPRPESLVMQSGTRGRSQSEAMETYGDKFYMLSDSDKSDSRKRSKSSGFPIPRQKEGVMISEDMLSKSLPHGKVVKSDSGLIEFIADDLQEKIRRSSPMSKTGK